MTPPLSHRSAGDSPPPLGWWAIAGDELIDLLRRAHAGESPDLLYAEAYANSDHERVEGNDA